MSKKFNKRDAVKEPNDSTSSSEPGVTDFRIENVLEAIDDYEQYRSKGRGDRSDSEDPSESEASDPEIDYDNASTITGSSVSDQDNSDNSDPDEPWEPPAKVRAKRSRSGQRKTSASATKCPFPPAPTTCTEKKRIHAVVPVDEPEDTKQLVNILRKKISIHSDSNSPKPDEASSSQMCLLSKSVNLVQSASSMKDWVVKLRSDFQDDRKSVIMDHFKNSYNSELRSELENGFYYWAEVSDGDLPSLYKSWMTSARILAMVHPTRKKYSDEEFGEIMTAAGMSCLSKLTELENLELEIGKLLKGWHTRSLELLDKKMNLLENYHALETDTEVKSRHLDESCDLGKKTLLEKFSSPYFKVTPSDSLQLVQSSYFVKNVHGDAFVHEKKQKWTNKDFQALKRFIHDVILEKEYGKRVDIYNYHQSRIAFKSSSTSQVPNTRKASSTSQTPSTSSLFSRGTGRGNNFKRPSLPKAAAASSQTAATLHRGIALPAGNPLQAQLSYSISGISLQKWFQQEEANLRKQSFEDLIKNLPSPAGIDWQKVSDRMVTETGKERTDLDCSLVWDHVVNPAINNKRWTVADTKKLVDLAKAKRPWDDIGVELNRTPYQCFFRFRNSSASAQNEMMKWDGEKDSKVVEILSKDGPKWNQAVELTMDHRATKHQVQERWKKSSSPIIRHGAFTRVEDALLLLTVEKLRNFIKREGHFGILLAYLPWRYETVWRDRANSLFSNWIVPWTVEEDKKLLELAAAQTGRKNWQEIAEQFTSFKNRKGCLTRHKILMSKLGDGPKKFESVEEYHEAYSMTRYNVFQYKHLIEVTQLLKRVLTVKPIGGTCILSRDEPPEEWRLRWMLLDFDREIVQETIANLEAYMESRDCYWKEWKEENGGIRKTFDRRGFNPDDPQSVASAIHIRGLELKSPTELDRTPTEFESQVMYHFARFKRTKPLKRDEDMKRPSIPSAESLCEMEEIGDIVKSPLEVPPEAPKATKSKKVNERRGVKAPLNRSRQKKKIKKTSAAPVRSSQRLKRAQSSESV